MSRPLRIEYEDAVYHVMNRGRARQTIFHDSTYYTAFLQCLSEAHQRFGLSILAYCLMGNHYHLLVKTPRGNLGRAMRHVNGLYTQRHNRMKRVDGALFRGRYKAILIDTTAYLLEVSRYIHRNPVETRKPLVTRLEKYQWSSYPAYINNASSPVWLSQAEIFGELGSAQRYASYKRFVEMGVDEETQRFYGKKNTPGIWGDKHFTEQAYLQSASWSKEITKSNIVTPIEIDEIVKQVANYFDVDVETIYKAKRGAGYKNIPRWIAMKLCQDHSGKKLEEIGNEFGVGNYCTVSQSISRLRKLMAEEKSVTRQFNAISKDLTP